MPDPRYESSLLTPGRDWHVDEAIRARAYELWQEAGRPEGTHPSGRSWAEHLWLRAEAEIAKNGIG
jgi:hypothetical protein